jgi:oxaloacetate decarboxylase gamma subunit
MDIGALLLEAASLMLTGMVGVFAFLSILIFAVSKLSLIAGGDEPAKPQRQPTKRPTSTGYLTRILLQLVQLSLNTDQNNKGVHYVTVKINRIGFKRRAPITACYAYALRRYVANR